MQRCLVWLIALCMGLLTPTLLTAEVILRPHDPALVDRPHEGTPLLTDVVPKLDQLSDLVVVPFFEVDIGNPAGTTTLYAVSNLNLNPTDLEIRYLNPLGMTERTDLESLGPFETLSINLRDVAGLPTSGGVARGAVVITNTSAPAPAPSNNAPILKGIASNRLAGDFFLVDIGGAFATGERLISAPDLCSELVIRFLDFGSGTKLRLFINLPGGSDPMTDPPSVRVTPIGEDGGLFPTTDIFTDQLVLEVEASDFTSLSFGSLVFSFASGGGWVYGEYSADGLFSVGLNAVCAS